MYQLGPALGTCGFTIVINLYNIFQYLYNTYGINQPNALEVSNNKCHQMGPKCINGVNVSKSGTLPNLHHEDKEDIYKRKIINKTKVNIINTWRYYTVLKENDDDFENPTNKDQPTFKQFWLAAYNKHRKTRETTKNSGYHGAPWTLMTPQQ